MKSWGRIIAGVVLGSVLLTGTAAASVAAKSKVVSVEKYAKTVCGSYLGLESAIEDFADTYSSITTEDPVQFQTEAVTQATTLVDEITTIQTKLKKQQPDIDDGKKIAKLFVTNVEELKSEISDARDALQSADASGAAFVADVTQFEVALQLLSSTLSDPFGEVQDQDLLGAFGDEKSCEKVVTIIGG